MKRYVEAIVRYKWWFIPPILIIPILAAISSFILFRAYESKATIWVDSQPIFTQAATNAYGGTQTASQQTVESIFELLRTRRFVQDIAIDAGMIDEAEAEDLTDSYLDDIRKNLDISWYGPHVVVITYSSKNLQNATDVVSSTLTLFNARSIQTKKETSTVAASFYQGQVDNYQTQLSQAADELRAFKEKHPAPLDPRTPRPPAEEQELNRLQNQYDTVEATYRSLVNKLDDARLTRDAEAQAAPTAFKILDQPSIPKQQTTEIRRVAVVTGAGLAGALVLVVIAAFLLMIFDSTIHFPEELAKVTNLPVITALPSEKLSD